MTRSELIEDAAERIADLRRRALACENLSAGRDALDRADMAEDALGNIDRGWFDWCNQILIEADVDLRESVGAA